MKVTDLVDLEKIAKEEEKERKALREMHRAAGRRVCDEGEYSGLKHAPYVLLVAEASAVQAGEDCEGEARAVKRSRVVHSRRRTCARRSLPVVGDPASTRRLPTESLQG